MAPFHFLKEELMLLKVGQTSAITMDSSFKSSLYLAFPNNGVAGVLYQFLVWISVAFESVESLRDASSLKRNVNSQR